MHLALRSACFVYSWQFFLCPSSQLIKRLAVLNLFQICDQWSYPIIKNYAMFNLYLSENYDFVYLSYFVLHSITIHILFNWQLKPHRYSSIRLNSQDETIKMDWALTHFYQLTFMKRIQISIKQYIDS